ncbi:hypothetical protein ZIOFF_017601 [Zingiber officinale]|uniref:Uncharacterized protein n=1 Tax=Zingiber officinale TaxID=94328 RepID=A0A8J5LLG5_ZINOF|nr:hypothetical protein ZIOFF_017601 [Zingiber officinale]
MGCPWTVKQATSRDREPRSAVSKVDGDGGGQQQSSGRCFIDHLQSADFSPVQLDYVVYSVGYGGESHEMRLAVIGGGNSRLQTTVVLCPRPMN